MNPFPHIWRKRRSKEAEAALASFGTNSSVVALPDAGIERRFLARQAILDKNHQVFGYELLARAGWENRFTGDSDDATRKMISDGALYGYEALTYGKPAFVNCTRESLVEGLVTLLPKVAVLEILETIEPDAAVISACRALKASGYQIALDDFRFSPGMDDLLELADYVKVDFRLSDAAERREILAHLRGTKVQLLAEKVETAAEFKIAESEGFHLFQGYFFCQPTMFTVQRPSTTGAAFLRLFAALSEKECDLVHIAGLLKSEPAICYQLLRLVNSAAYGFNCPVESLQHALMLVGEDQVRKLVLNAITVEACTQQPRELLVRTLHRARFLELMAPYTGQEAQEQYLFGLLTMIDVLLQVPAATLLNTLPLRAEVKDALNGKSNEVSVAQRLFGFYDEGNWNHCVHLSMELNITEKHLTSIYCESLQWAEQTTTPEHHRVH